MTVLQQVDGRLLVPGTPPFDRNDKMGIPYIVTAPGHGLVALSGNLTTTFELIYEKNPTAGAVINKLSKQLATIPVRVYDRPGVSESPVRVTGHPLEQLLEHPAPRKGAAYWKQGLARSALVHGNGLLAKFRADGGLPTALLPVAWPYAAAYAGLGCPVEWWATYQTGMQRFFPVEDSVHLAWDSSNLNGLGISPLQQLASTIKADDAARRYHDATFSNAAKPAGAIVPPEGFKYQDGQREELRSELKRMYEGVDNAGRVVLMGPGFDWKTMSHTAVEAEVMAARELNREEIAMVYDVPPPMIGDLTHGTYSNVEELHRILYVTTLRPWFTLIEEVIQRQLIDPEPEWEGLYVQFDLSEILRGNRREEIDAMSQAYLNGISTLNEVRLELGYKRLNIPEADIPHIQANNMKPVGAGSNKGLVINP